MTSAEIQSAYEKAFNVSLPGLWTRLMYAFVGQDWDSPFEFADAEYDEADEELIQMIVEADIGEQEEYEAEEFDCDDFAFSLMGTFHKDREAAAFPIFITWVSTPQGGHAVLSYYSEGEVKIIEPQNDEIFNVPSDWGLMLLCG